MQANRCDHAWNALQLHGEAMELLSAADWLRRNGGTMAQVSAALLAANVLLDRAEHEIASAEQQDSKKRAEVEALEETLHESADTIQLPQRQGRRDTSAIESSEPVRHEQLC